MKKIVCWCFLFSVLFFSGNALGWTLAYQTDGLGNVLNGDYETLKAEIENGKDLKITIRTETDHVQSYPVFALFEFDGYLLAQTKHYSGSTNGSHIPGNIVYVRDFTTNGLCGYVAIDGDGSIKDSGERTYNIINWYVE